MNTYFELITYLENVVSLDINNEAIKNLNELKVDLRGDRYNRFLNHILDILDNRINMYYKELHDNLDKIHNINEFEDKFNEVLEETEMQLKLIDINLINDEDQNKLSDFIKTNFNEIINRLRNYYKGNGAFVHYLDNYYLE